jgi:hypothetical protein
MKFSAQMQGRRSLCPVPNRIYHKNLIKQFMRIGALAFILLTASLQLIMATPVKAQDMTVEKVSVGLKEEPMLSAIKQIEKQTTLRFFYQRSELKTLDKLNLPLSRRTVEQTLYELLQNTGLSFRQIDQSILIKGNDNAPQLKRKISGTVFTSDTKEAVKFASVMLIRKSDLQIVGQSATDVNGHFELVTTDNAAHMIRISLLGYHIYSAQIDDQKDVVLPSVFIEPDPKELKEVIISARSPLIKQEVDRLSYNVQSDPESKYSSLLDILRKVPLITVDADENVRLKGSSSFKVLIDGHASSLVVNNPKDIFRSMSSINILRIEVITIPPAKYDGEGLAGIINVITIKNRIDGYNANVSSSYKFPNGLRRNGNLNYKRGKIALSTYGGWNDYNTPHTSFSNLRQSLTSAAVTNQEGAAQTKSDQAFVSTQLSYEADSLNLFSAVASYNGGKSHRTGTILTMQTDDAFQQYRIDNDGRTKQNAYEFGMDYQKGFRRNKSQLLSFSYRYSASQNDQFNILNASELINTNVGNYNQNNTAKLNENTAQVDYVHPLNKLTIEAGAKMILRNTNSDYTITGTDPINGNPISGTENNDQFNYEQHIFSVYNSYQLNLKKWTLKAGLRLERTDVSADFSNVVGLNIPGYTNLIPSIALQRKLSQASNLNFGYTERILRPGILQLNPYVDRQNPYFISFGNPLLKPELNHTFSFTFSSYKKFGISAGLSYSYSNNTIQNISSLGADGITRGTFENLGSNKSLELNVNINYPISDKLNFSFNAQVSQIRLKGMIESVFYSRNAVTGSGFANFNYNLGHEWKTTLNFQFYSPGITLQSTSTPYYYSSIGLSKAVFNKKFVISGSMSNPYLQYLDYQITYKDPRFTQVSHNDIVYRRFNIGVSYQVGKLRDGSIKKNKKAVQNDDIKVIKSIIPVN